MSAKKNESLVCRFLNEAYNKGNLAGGHDLLTENCVFHLPDTDIEGVQGWRRFASGFLTAFPDDLQLTVKDTVAKGSKVAVRWSARGTQAGPLRGIDPTHRQMQWTGIAIYHLTNGKIEQAWCGSHALCIM
jgi:predicted ester cyclase